MKYKEKLEIAIDEINYHIDSFGRTAGILVAIEEGMKLAGFHGLWLSRESFTHSVFKNRNWNERIIYWYIYYRSNEEGVCNSFNWQIADDLGMSYNVVQKTILKLKKGNKTTPILLQEYKSKTGRRYLKWLAQIKMDK